MKMQTFLTEVENTYKKYFPHSRIRVEFSSRLYSNICVKAYMAGDKSELSGGYWDNDMLNVMFWIDTIYGQFNNDITLESELSSSLKLEASQKSYHIKPSSRMCVYGSRKLSFRKAEGTPEKILQSLDKFFSKLKDSLVDDYNNDVIHPSNRELIGRKLSL